MRRSPSTRSPGSTTPTIGATTPTIGATTPSPTTPVGVVIKRMQKKQKKNNKTVKQAKAKPKPTKADNLLKIKPIKM